MEFLEIIEKRKSIRKFSDKPVEKEKLDQLLSIINKAPSAGNMQSFKIFVLTNKEIKKKLWEFKPNQTFLMESTFILVFCQDKEQNRERFGERGQNFYSVLDAAIACTFAHLATFELGLGSVWVGAFEENIVKKSLTLPEHLSPIALLPVGYPAESPDPKPRRKIDEIVEFID
jgi:nitroreductase